MSVAPQPDPELADHAHTYAAAGLDIFPVNPHDKTPLVSQYKATTDHDTIAAWWHQHPRALIGHRIAPDVVVLDIDPRHGGNTVWRALLDAFPARPVTRWHRSGRGDGGGHTWWQRPADKTTITTLDQWAKERGLGHAIPGSDRWTCGIDILHHNHRYTILPPSPHPDTGKPYTWATGGLDTPVAPMPALLADLITHNPPPTPARPPRAPDPDSIADWYTTNHTWTALLSAHGWTLRAGDGNTDGSRWRHPTATSAFSATIRHGCLFVYSPNTPFEQTASQDPHGYTLYRAYATLEHAGDLQAAGRAAREKKDGPRGPAAVGDDLSWIGPAPTADFEPTGLEHTAPAEEAPQTPLDKLRAALLTTAAIRNLPPPDHLIAGYLNRNSLATLYGPSGGGKTFLALDWALHVATGSWWHRHDTTAGRVLYIIAEGASGVGGRLDAWQTHHGIRDLDGHQPVTWLPQAVNLAAPIDVTALRTIANEIQPALVIVDTLARCTVGVEENSAKDIGVVIANLDVIRRATGACVLTVHHTGKDASNGARGSSALRAAMDTEIELVGDDNVAVKVTKQKDGPEPAPLWLARQPVANSLVLVPASEAPERDDLPASAVEALEELRAIQIPGGVPWTAWKATSSVPERTLYRVRQKLLEAGLIHNLGTESQPRWSANP